MASFNRYKPHFLFQPDMRAIQIAALLLFLILMVFQSGSVFADETSLKYAGTYKIDGWEEMEGKKVFHFFYLHPAGEFLLGGEWPEHETSRAVGTWSVNGNRLILNGSARVITNKGHWRVPFQREFTIYLRKEGIGLKPTLLKNRFGLLGWPNDFFFFRNRPLPNLPSGEIPDSQDNLRAMIKFLMEEKE